MATNNHHKSADSSKSLIMAPKIMMPKSTVTIVTNTGWSLLFNDTPTCNQSIKVSDFNKKGSGVSKATQASSGCGSTLSPPCTLKMLSDTVSMATKADRTMSFGSFSDGSGGVAFSCYDDSKCDAFVERIQSFLDASPPPLTPPTSSLTDRKYTDTSLLLFPKIQCTTDVSSIQSTDTTIDDQWNIADSISQKYLTKNIIQPPPQLLPPPPLLP
uniref:Uncharacterized protein n=1 Tax=Amphimedon queenslandica TaxID=400682 RepID=A0A1X7TX18_AMPQE